MNLLAICISIVLHVVILVSSYFDAQSFIKQKPIKDTGHAVFDFVTISTKSKAPILSPEKSRAGQKKSYTNENKKQTENKQYATDHQDNENACTKTEITDSKTDKSIKSAKNVLKPRRNKKKTIKKADNVKESNSKNSNKQNLSKKTTTKVKQNTSTKTKTGSKALVSKVNKSKTSGLKNGEKSAFDSLIDNALADGNYENSGLNAEEIGDTLTATQIDMVRETIRPCWHFPVGLKDAERLVVDIKMELNQGGYVTSASVADTARFNRESDFRTAAESAIRAVLDPDCNPLPLPKDKYNEWKDLELSFNPKDLA